MAGNLKLLLESFLASCAIEGCFVLVSKITGAFALCHLIVWIIIAPVINIDRLGVLAAEVTLAAVHVLLLTPVSYFIFRTTDGESANGLG